MLQKSLIISNVVLLTVLGVLFFDSRFQSFEKAKAQRDYSSEYKFTNPILDYENIQMEDAAISYNKVKDRISDLQEKYNISFHSYYFRDLDNGQWIGNNEKATFTSASLIKLPIFISFLRQTEIDPKLAEKTVVVMEEDVRNASIQDIKPEHTLTVGESLTLSEVAERMIKYSDNVAMKVLVKNIDDKYRNGIFGAIGVDYKIEGTDVIVRVKDYAGFFRVLFNASYLSRENSELALRILSQTSFTKGLVAGVPSVITVAHKFGERSYYVDDKAVGRQLHDCGVVYYPQRPYMLCIMTRGNNFDDQAAFIREVSKLFYLEMENNF